MWLLWWESWQSEHSTFPRGKNNSVRITTTQLMSHSTWYMEIMWNSPEAVHLFLMFISSITKIYGHIICMTMCISTSKEWKSSPEWWKAQPLETHRETAETPTTREALIQQEALILQQEALILQQEALILQQEALILQQEALILQQSPEQPPDRHHNTRATRRQFNDHKTLQLQNSTT